MSAVKAASSSRLPYRAPSLDADTWDWTGLSPPRRDLEKRTTARDGRLDRLSQAGQGKGHERKWLTGATSPLREARETGPDFGRDLGDVVAVLTPLVQLVLQ